MAIDLDTTSFVTVAGNQPVGIRQVDAEQQFPLGTRFEGHYKTAAGDDRYVIIRYVKAATNIATDSAGNNDCRILIQSGVSPELGDATVGVTALNGGEHLGVMIEDGYTRDGGKVVDQINAGEYFFVIADGQATVRINGSINAGVFIGSTAGGIGDDINAIGTEAYLGRVLQNSVNKAQVMVDALGGFGLGTTPLASIPSHAANHIQGGTDEIDGDKIDIDFTPSNYTPDTTPAETDNVDQLAAHLKGIDNELGGGVATHAGTHITGGSDEIDGDKLDIDFTPANYTPDTSPPEVDNADNLSAHLKGVDDALGSAGLPPATEANKFIFSHSGGFDSTTSSTYGTPALPNNLQSLAGLAVGTYVVLISVNTQIASPGDYVDFAIFRNDGVTEFLEAETTFDPSLNFSQTGIAYAKKVTITAGQDIELRWKVEPGGTMRAFCQTLIALKVA